MSLEGQQLGQYRLLRLIGSGGMGEVYLAEDARIHQQVAIKLNRTEAAPYPEAESGKEAARLFQREARAIAQLDHPRILPLFSYGEEEVNGVLLTYIVMPFRKEGSLTTWLRQRKNAARLSLQEVAHLVNQAADALQYAHNHHIVHQDVKPPNFLIHRHDETDSTTPDVLLTDFGIAKLSTATSGVSHTVRGTATYMAPEQWNGNAVPATDQYALAIMAYELLTGHPPFRGHPAQIMYLHFSAQPEPPSMYHPELSTDVDRVILKALSKRPEDRFLSVSAFADALQLASQSTDAPTFLKTLDSRGLPPLTPVSSAYEQTIPASKLSLPAVPPSPLPFHRGQNAHAGQRASSGRNMLIVGLILVLIAAGLGVFFFEQGNRAANSNHATPTAPPQAATATTVTVVATTSTAQSLTTPSGVATSANPYPPQSGTLVLNDPLSDNSQGHNWDVTPTSFGTCAFTAGAYHVVATNNYTYHRCGAQSTNFSNFAYEVQVKILTGSCAAVIFRGDFPNYHYYYFHICQDGSYALRLYTQNAPETKTFVESSSSSIHTGIGQSNVIAVVAINDALTLYVNHQALSTVHDSSYSQGVIGVAVDNDTSPTEAVFSQAKVWML